MKKTQRWMELLNILVEEQNFQTVAELAEHFANDTQRSAGYQFSTAPSWCRADKKTEHRNTSSLYTKTERGDLPAASKKSL